MGSGEWGKRLRWIVPAIVIVLVAGVIGGVMLWRHSATQQPKATAWSAIRAKVKPDGLSTLDTAKQEFSATYARLPGVVVPQGDPGPARSS